MIILAALLLGAGVGALAYGLTATRREMAAAVPVALLPEREDDEEHVVEVRDAGLIFRVAEPLMSFGGALMRRLSPGSRVELLRKRIVCSGREGQLTVEKLLSYKAAAALFGFLAGLAAPVGSFPPLVWASVVATLASFAPDLWLDSKARERQGAIARDLPEALDLLSITVEAGLGLEQAMEVVTENMEGPLGSEFNRILREIELGVSRREALTNLRDRTDVSELSSFVVALVQADQMGAPVADVLRIQADQVRLKRRQRAREKAAQVPVKILFPVIFFIFPALFVVTIGPGAIEIFENLLKR